MGQDFQFQTRKRSTMFIPVLPQNFCDIDPALFDSDSTMSYKSGRYFRAYLLKTLDDNYGDKNH